MTSHPAAEVIPRMLQAIDDLDWPGVEQWLADPVEVDYSSLSGQPRAAVSRAALLDGWRGLLPGFDATQHLTGPIVFDETGPGQVVASTTVRGYHWLGADEWMVAGRYTMTLARAGSNWHVTAITLTVLRQTGVLSLPEAARARAASHPRRPSADR